MIISMPGFKTVNDVLEEQSNEIFEKSLVVEVAKDHFPKMKQKFTYSWTTGSGVVNFSFISKPIFIRFLQDNLFYHGYDLMIEDCPSWSDNRTLKLEQHVLYWKYFFFDSDSFL